MSDSIPTLTDVVSPGSFTAAPPTVDLSSLSKRERQVLELLAIGHGVNDIGRQLSLSPKTVSTYRMRVGEKLSIETKPQWMTLYRAVHGAPEPHRLDNGTAYLVKPDGTRVHLGAVSEIRETYPTEVSLMRARARTPGLRR